MGDAVFDESLLLTFSVASNRLSRLTSSNFSSSHQMFSALVHFAFHFLKSKRRQEEVWMEGSSRVGGVGVAEGGGDV